MVVYSWRWKQGLTANEHLEIFDGIPAMFIGVGRQNVYWLLSFFFSYMQYETLEVNGFYF